MTGRRLGDLGPAALALLLALAMPAAAAAFWQGGLVESEATRFVRQYTDGRGLFRQVFDPRANDFGAYQARELSYLVDALDARLLEAALRRGPLVLVPASGVLAQALTVAAFAAAAWRVAPASLLAPALGALLLATSVSTSVTQAVYYRSAKPLLVPVLVVLAFAAYDSLRGRGPARPARTFAALGSLAALLDRQGFFEVAALAAVLAVFAGRDARARPAVTGLAAALAATTVYNLWLGRTLVHLANGYWPRLNYQRVDPLALLRKPERFGQALELQGDALRLLLGGLPAVVCTLALLLAAAALVATVRDRGQRRRAAAALFVAAASQVVLFGLMIVRHRPLHTHYDHRVWYYPQPFQALAVVLVVLALARAEPLWPRAARAARAVIVALALANLAAWPAERARLLAAPWFPTIHGQTALLRASLAARQPDPGLDADFRAFFDWCTSRRP